MPGSTSPSSAAGASAVRIGDNKSIQFHIKAGNNRWACTLQDRATYERIKAARANSVGSASSASSASSSGNSPGNSSASAPATTPPTN